MEEEMDKSTSDPAREYFIIFLFLLSPPTKDIKVGESIAIRKWNGSNDGGKKSGHVESDRKFRS